VFLYIKYTVSLLKKRENMEIGTAMALQGASGLLGIGLNQQGNQQQMQQQQQLMQQQFQNQQALNLQGQQIQQQNWDYTNYENQVKHMENAGLNVGLMYGMGGGGGQSMGAGGGGGASGGNAPQNNAPQIMALAQDAALKAAQVELTNAQANKLKSETPTEGNLGNTSIENTKADTALKGVNTQLNQLQLEVSNTTKDWTIDGIKAKANEAQSIARQALVQANVDEMTQQTKMAQIGLDYLKTAVEKTNVEQMTEESKQRIIQGAQRLKLESRNLDIQAFKTKIEEFKANLQSEYPQAGQIIGKLFNDFIGLGDTDKGDKLYRTIK